MHTNLLSKVDYDHTNTIVSEQVRARIEQYSIMLSKDFVLPASPQTTNLKDLMHTFTGRFYSFKNSETRIPLPLESTGLPDNFVRHIPTSKHKHKQTQTHKHTHTHIYINIYIRYIGVGVD